VGLLHLWPAITSRSDLPNLYLQQLKRKRACALLLLNHCKPNGQIEQKPGQAGAITMNSSMSHCGCRCRYV
jgi:hypothetical protein